MTDNELNIRVEQLRAAFEKETGRSFTHFFCPILHSDEPEKLCKGHIIPKAFGTCNIWVPQRADIDNFYGSVAEADFIAAVQDRSKTPFEKWVDPTLRKRHRPCIEFGGVRLPHYFPNEHVGAPGHTSVQVVGNNGETICNVVVKMSPQAMKSLPGNTLTIAVERDYRPALVASLLKAAHLTLFRMLGYNHVFSPDGEQLAHILRTFFVTHRETPRNQLQEPIAAHFRRYSDMISPMMVKDASVLQGTVTDNRVLGCIGGSEGIFAIGVVVKAGSDMFCVFLPSSDGKTLDTYFGFLKDPPPSIAVRLLEYCPADGKEEARWITAPGEPLRIPLPNTLPKHDEGRGRPATARI